MTRLARLAALVATFGAGCSDPTGPEREISGEAMYNQYCARCHGMDGSGVPEQPSTKERLSSKLIMSAMSDEKIEHSILRGKPPGMPGFGDQFTPGAVKVLAAYVRSLSGTAGSRLPPPAADP